MGPISPGYPLMILDHIVAQDVRGLENPDILRIPNLDLELRRDSAPAARRPCKDVVTTTTTTTTTRNARAVRSCIYVLAAMPRRILESTVHLLAGAGG